MSVAPTTSPVVFEVADVAPATTALPEVAYKDAVEALLTRKRRKGGPRRPVEACSRYHGRLVARVRYHPVVAAAHRAFQDHRPLVLSPDVIWLLVAQGFANHVNADPEARRADLVAHQGRVTIQVRRDDFVKGSPENPWAEVFGEFSGRIREHVGAATHDLLRPDFSTTGPVERAAAEVVLMDAVKSYFDYECVTLCGVPRVVLEGTAEDWAALAERARGLERFGLGRWTRPLGPILDEFVAASRGRPDRRFWRKIYKPEDESGGPYITGWLTAFFPYLADEETGRAVRQNPWLARGGVDLQKLLHPPGRGRGEFASGPTTEDFPGGLARAPFRWEYLGDAFEMEFVGGFVGVRQDPDTLALRPEIGWAVRDAAAG